MTEEKKKKAKAIANELEIVGNLIADKKWKEIETTYGRMGVKLLASELYHLIPPLKPE